MPFITEELWQHFGDDEGMLIHAAWPANDIAPIDEAAKAELESEEELRLENEQFAVQELYDEEEERFLQEMGEEQSPRTKSENGILCPVCRSANLVPNPSTNAIVCLYPGCIHIDWMASDGQRSRNN
mgnify:CR=1 FL=1